MELLIILGLMVLNGLFALSEMAIVAVNKARLQLAAESGNHRAQTALQLSNNPEKVLSTVQIGITLIGIFAGAFGGSTLTRPLGKFLSETIPSLAESAEAIAVAFIVSLTTYLSLVIGELVPKQLALKNAEAVSILMARPLILLSQLVAPLVYLLNASTNAVIRLMRIKPTTQETITEAEIISLIRQGIHIGIFDSAEESMVRNVMNLDERRIASFITPRIDIVSIDVQDSIETIRQILIDYPHSTFPVVEGDLDNIKGYVRSKNIVTHLLKDQFLSLSDLMVQPLFVPENINTSQLLAQFKQTGIHTAIVFNEYGSNIGLIRLHDIIEQIVGEVDGGEFDTVDPDIVERSDGSHLIDGLLPLYQLSNLYNDFQIPDDEIGRYDTLAGFIMERLERIPREADNFQYEGLQFEVVDMDGNHIDKVLIKRVDSIL